MVAERDGELFGLGPVPYYTFGLGRAFTLAGAKTVNGKDWYRIGADAILASQQDDGSWFKSSLEEPDVLETCWQMLFLSHATVPAIPR